MPSSSPPDSRPVLGIDIGGTGIKGAPVHLDTGTFAADRVRLPTPSPATPEQVAEVVGQIITQLDVPGPVGLTLPAVIRAGVVETAANIDESWIGSAVFVDGTLVPNTELGHLPLHHEDAEDWAAESIREDDELSWKQWAHRLERYLELVQRLLWPQLFIIGGGVSKKADKFLPHITLRTEIVPAQLHNDAGIVGAALFAPSQRESP